MTRILLLLDTTGPGGAETVFIDLTTRLGGEGFETIPALQGPGWVADRLETHGITPLFEPSHARFDLSYMRKLAHLIRDTGADLVHAHLSSTALYGGLAARLAGVPAVATFHGIPDLGTGRPSDGVRYALIRWCHRRVVHVSRSLRDEAVQRGLFQAEDTEVIYNGVDLEAFSGAEPLDLRGPFGIGAEAMLVGAVGNLRPLKDYPTLIRAAASLRSIERRPTHFFVAGEGSEQDRRSLEDLACRAGVADRVHLLGFVDDVPGYLAGLDLFVLSSSSEGFSIATIQAMAAGRPVVVTRSGGPEEIVTDGSDGLLVPPGLPDEMAAAIVSLQSDPGRTQAMAERGRETVRRTFSIDAMIQAYGRLYASVLPERSPRRSA